MLTGAKARAAKPKNKPYKLGDSHRLFLLVNPGGGKLWRWNYRYDDLESLKAHALAFVTAYNFAKHLKALHWRTPFQAICKAWTNDPSIFKIDPHHLISRPHI